MITATEAVIKTILTNQSHYPSLAQEMALERHPLLLAIVVEDFCKRVFSHRETMLNKMQGELLEELMRNVCWRTVAERLQRSIACQQETAETDGWIKCVSKGKKKEQEETVSV